VVNVYNTAGKMLGQITGSFLNEPDGMAVDAKGNLFVTNYGAGTTVVFAKGAKKPQRTLTDAGTTPVDVVVAADGTAFVSNGSGHGGAGFIDVYAPGAKKPTRTLQDAASDPLGLGVTLDAHGNLYWSLITGRGAGAGAIDEFAKAKGAPIATNIAIQHPGGLFFDSKSNLVVCDVTAPAVDVFPPGATVPSLQYARVGQPLFHAFNPSESEDYVADYASLNVGVYAYPSGTLKRKITKGFSKAAPQGIALDPRAKY
jgi:DNA-binding beta-propeller fold protein YncE